MHPLSVSSALGIFDPTQAKVVLAFDIYGNYHPPPGRPGANGAELHKYIAREEEAIRPRAAVILDGADIKPAETIFKPGFFNTYDPVLEAATETAADLIVVGTKRKKAFEWFRLGSISEALLRRADADVLVIPPEE